jgi:hypothetical protein
MGSIRFGATVFHRLALVTPIDRNPRVTDLLNNPAVQAGLLPFMVALALGYLLAGTRFLALAAASGVIVVLSLTIGLSLEPFTSVKKMVVVTLIATAIALALEAASTGARRNIVAILAATAGAAAVWTLQRVLQQMDSTAAWMVVAGAFALALATTGGAIIAGGSSSLRGAVIGACLGWGSGVLALLGASALLAQLGLALGSASAAVALLQMLRGREAPLGWTVVVPAAVAAPIIGVLACATGELRWYCLIPLPFVALAAHLVPAGAFRRPWQTAFATGFAALVPVLAAVGLTWLSAASSSSPAG